VIVGDRVVFGSGDGRLYVVSLADGKQLWSYDVGRGVASSPAVVGGRIFVGSLDGTMYAFGSAKMLDMSRDAAGREAKLKSDER
jgi:outer membrane protein assembly factor BamB